MTAREQLKHLLEQMVLKSVGKKLALGAAIDELADASFCIVGILVCLPFLFPLPILGPLTIPGGLAIAALGWQMMRGEEHVRLPKRLASLELSEGSWRGLAKACDRMLSISAKLSKQRWAAWTEGKLGEKRAGYFMFVGGILLAIPMGGVLPLNNTLPAIAATCGCLAILDRNGTWFVFGVFWLVVTVLYFTAAVIVFLYFGDQFMAWFNAHRPAWF